MELEQEAWYMGNIKEKEDTKSKRRTSRDMGNKEG